MLPVMPWADPPENSFSGFPRFFHMNDTTAPHRILATSQHNYFLISFDDRFELIFKEGRVSRKEILLTWKIRF
jgi:hypothetical protein